MGTKPPAKPPAWSPLLLSLVVWLSALGYLFTRGFHQGDPAAYGCLVGMFAVVVHWFGGSATLQSIAQDLTALAATGASPIAAAASSLAQSGSSSSQEPSPPRSNSLASGSPAQGGG